MSDHPLRHLMRLVESDLHEGPHTDAIDALPAPKPGFVRVYHAQQHSIPGVLTNREVKSYNSMGTWFATDPGMVHFLYGDNAQAYDIPEGPYLEPSDDYLIQTLGHCYPIIEKHFGKKEAEHLMAHPWSREAQERYRHLDDILKDETKFMPSKTRARLWQEAQALYQSEKIVRKAIRSADYCRDFRDMIVGARYNGFCWRNSNFDGAPRAMDVYLVFHTEDVHPVSEVLPEPDDAAELDKGRTYMQGYVRGMRN